jgi:hypothetical protein
VQRCQVQATLIITTKLSSSSHFTYFFAVVAFLSVGSGQKLKENLMGEGNLKTKRLNSFKSLHNIKLRVTDSSKKSSCEASRRLDRKVLIRLPIKTHFVPTKASFFTIIVIIIIIIIITGVE